MGLAQWGGVCRRFGTMAVLAVALTAASVAGFAGAASADVSIDSEQGQRTGGARIAFRVTNESSTASITKVEVRFPGDVRIPEIYPIAVADWAPSITMTKVDNNPANDVPTSVVWVTMPGREIKPGATSVLPLAMGPMPDIETVYLDVVQTRSDGSIETWAGVDVPAAGAQHPAFALKLTPLEPGQVPEHGHGGAGASGQAQTGAAADPAAEEPASAEGSSTVRLVLVLLLIVALTGFALFWQRRRGAPSADEDLAEAADDAAPAVRVPAQREKGAPPKRAAAATRAPAPAEAAPAKAEEVAEPARVQRRSVVRATAAKTAAERRAAARKSTGGAATVTVARRRGNASKRAGNTEGDNA